MLQSITVTFQPSAAGSVPSFLLTTDSLRDSRQIMDLVARMSLQVDSDDGTYLVRHVLKDGMYFVIVPFPTVARWRNEELFQADLPTLKHWQQLHPLLRGRYRRPLVAQQAYVEQRQGGAL